MNIVKTIKYFGYLVFINVYIFAAQSPKLTVIIVIDQFAYNYLDKLKPYLNGGIKFLLNNGINYTNAFYLNGTPTTCPGHAMLATGTFGHYHGIIGNKWFNSVGKSIECDNDSAKNAAVLAPNGKLYNYGKSAKNIMVDGLSDQIIINSMPNAENQVWSLSLKSRAAIAMAGKLGKAIWFDGNSGDFTTSKAYFDALPDWVKDFNKKQKIDQITEFIWEQFFKTTAPYDFCNVNNYKYAGGQSIINKKHLINPTDKNKFDQIYTKTPLANQNLIDLALTCLDKKWNNNNFILWLSLSSLDKVGHKFGPYSKEAIDMIYHMDNQLLDFIKYIFSIVNKKDTLIILTADHGISPIPEILKDDGLDIAQRYVAGDLIKELNKIIEKKYNIPNFIINFEDPQFYVDQTKLSQLSQETKNQIYKDIKKYLLSKPGVQNVWTFEELENKCLSSKDPNFLLKKQLYKGRSGQIIVVVKPYTQISNFPRGTTHNSPYIFDRQVPLIFYQAGKFTKQTINKNVYITQVAPTLAEILNVPRPSAAFYPILPGIKI